MDIQPSAGIAVPEILDPDTYNNVPVNLRLYSNNTLPFNRSWAGEGDPRIGLMQI